MKGYIYCTSCISIKFVNYLHINGLLTCCGKSLTITLWADKTNLVDVSTANSSQHVPLVVLTSMLVKLYKGIIVFLHILLFNLSTFWLIYKFAQHSNIRSTHILGEFTFSSTNASKYYTDVNIPEITKLITRLPY